MDAKPEAALQERFPFARRMSNNPMSPNHALQRTARIVPSDCGAASARSLSFWSLGVFTGHE